MKVDGDYKHLFNMLFGPARTELTNVVLTQKWNIVAKDTRGKYSTPWGCSSQCDPGAYHPSDIGYIKYGRFMTAVVAGELVDQFKSSFKGSDITESANSEYLRRSRSDEIWRLMVSMSKVPYESPTGRKIPYRDLKCHYNLTEGKFVLKYGFISALNSNVFLEMRSRWVSEDTARIVHERVINTLTTPGSTSASDPSEQVNVPTAQISSHVVAEPISHVVQGTIPAPKKEEPNDDKDLEITGSRSWKEIDAALRSNAIDLTDDPPPNTNNSEITPSESSPPRPTLNPEPPPNIAPPINDLSQGAHIQDVDDDSGATVIYGQDSQDSQDSLESPDLSQTDVPIPSVPSNSVVPEATTTPLPPNPRPTKRKKRDVPILQDGSIGAQVLSEFIKARDTAIAHGLPYDERGWAITTVIDSRFEIAVKRRGTKRVEATGSDAYVRLLRRRKGEPSTLRSVPDICVFFGEESPCVGHT